ncbi:MAG: NAD-dependent epimerase/dehydratase family protein, partial [Spirochaetia bacterium]|nr:NAD-dependent epimerase/dehydratase family protein [Spirochaetia bacterium]
MILLTGCSGLIGKNLLAELLQQGKNIRCYDFLKPAGAPQGVSFTGGDLLNEASLAAALDGVHTVFHCLDIKRPGSKGRRYMKKVNVKGTAAILAASKKAGVSRFFFISTHSV